MINKIQLVSSLVIMAIVDIILLLFVSEWTTTRIVSLAVIDAAFVLSIVVPYLSPKNENNYLYSTTSGFLVMGYLILELIIGIAVIVTGWEGLIPMIIQVVLLVLVILFLAIMLSTNSRVEKEMGVKNASKDDIQAVKGEIKDAYNKASRENRPAIERAMDDVGSLAGFGAAFADIDEELLSKSRDLVDAASADDADRIAALSKEISDLCSRRRKIRYR